MVDIDVSVLVVEENATRADLYDHWLVGFDVRKAITTRQAVEAHDRDVAVVLLDEEFGDGAAPDLIEWFDRTAKFCQVVTTTMDRGRLFPEQDVDEHLVKPVFKDELRSVVKRLARQTVYATLLAKYYSTTLQLANVRDEGLIEDRAVNDEEARGDGSGTDADATDADATDADATDADAPDAGATDADTTDADGPNADMTDADGPNADATDRPDRESALEERVERLKSVILQLKGSLDEEDMRRVSELIAPTREPSDAESSQTSKYMPASCSQCGRPWGGDEESGVLRLGAGVFRCTDCGNVQFVAAAGNPRLRRSR